MLNRPPKYTKRTHLFCPSSAMIRFLSSPHTAVRRTMSLGVQSFGKPGRTDLSQSHGAAFSCLWTKHTQKLDKNSLIHHRKYSLYTVLFKECFMPIFVYRQGQNTRHFLHSRLTSSLNSSSESNVITLTGNDLSDFFRRNGIVNIGWKCTLCTFTKPRATYRPSKTHYHFRLWQISNICI